MYKRQSIGISIFKLESKKAITIDGVDYTLVEALAQKQYNKVYICLGVNELGYFNDQGFYDSYCKVIDDIRASQPNAVIYIQNLIPLNEDTIACLLYTSMLRVVDEYWMDQIDAMNDLKQGIGLRAYAQTDPVVAYKKEGYELSLIHI